MTNYSAKKVVLKNNGGDYLVPIAYSAKYDMNGNVIDVSSLQPKSTAVTHVENTGSGNNTTPIYVNSLGEVVACSYSLPTVTLLDYNLSNLSSLGKDNLVTYANLLDWANAILVDSTTTSGTGAWDTYSPTQDGVLYVYSSTSGSSATKTILTRIYPSNLQLPFWDGFVGSWTTATSYAHGTHRVVCKNETVSYGIQANGPSVGSYVYFIPFKKSLT